MAAGEWAKDSTGWMWMAKSGRAVRDRWVRYDGNWYYLNASGVMLKNTSHTINGKVYPKVQVNNVPNIINELRAEGGAN